MGEGDILVIADGAAFGAMIEKCLEFFGSEDNRRITGWFPEEIRKGICAKCVKNHGIL
jgi:hypothetical protein